MRKTREPAEFVIDDGHPIPEPRRGRRAVYEWHRMAVGQSHCAAPDRANSARVSACLYKRRNPGWDYAVERYRDGSARIWRVR